MQEMRVQSLDPEDCPEGGNSSPFTYSCLENATDRGTWQAAVRGVGSQSRTCTTPRQGRLTYQSTKTSGLAYMKETGFSDRSHENCYLM